MALSNRDEVRLRCGDTDMTDALLTDEEYDVFLTTRTLVDSAGDVLGVNLHAAAADAAGAIAAKFARGYNFQTDGQSFSRSERVNHYTALEGQLRRLGGGVSAPLSLAGTETT